MKILLIEDDADVARAVRAHLRADFTVTVAAKGAQGLERLDGEKYQLVILDLNLPDMPGKRICEQIRQADKEVPILILTGTADTEIQIELLTAGADDYVTKPFDSRQLRARIDALLRRSGLTAGATLKTHDLVMDTRRRQVTRAGSSIALRRKEYDILEYLMRHKGQAVTRDMICDEVWDRAVRPNSIDVHIKHLRDKVDRPFAAELIKTLHGIGYMVKDVQIE
ncbi:MAG TPA: response regulator transcription factor [Candidatus Saccharimonadales bacterium]|nr:response regulator transcription factor [Candidatus Saccharimonadales bacterium]